MPGGGWPQSSVTELLTSRSGCGELKLLLPALASLTQAGKRVVLVAPPNIPYAPAWQAAGVDLRQLTWLAPASEHDALWAMEQALREPACGAVLGWFEQSLGDRNCRRMQLAAEQGAGCGFVLRQSPPDKTASPFSLRLGIESVAGGVAVQVLKRRGAPAARPVFLPHASLSSGQVHAVASAALPLPAARRARPQPYAHAA
ncbi:translesion DNA synthesis-associated protein ImuA [Chitinimonas arctica]|uniref:translesion DNA synthesis-associated protein ImuA n=1 Tax=Chitinimonas arctica TaxID=2594795 RepID=UPI0021DFE29C|nr:translesion DNA synthesis-associated protein ImuA [Chitinimonas arctica]